jgi:hypothetical protein
MQKSLYLSFLLLSSCSIFEEREEVSYKIVGQIEECGIYRVKVKGMPPQLLLKCDFNSEKQCRLPIKNTTQ